MKLLCECGETIHDISDDQENKARFVSDETFEILLDSFDSEVRRSDYF